jgi:hypothetical protein
MFECLQIRENSVVIYENRIYSSCYANRVKKRQEVAAARKTQYCGKMTTGARKRLSKATTLLCQGTKAKWMFSPQTGKYHYHRLSFITLTIPSNKKIDGIWAYEYLLKPFLRWMREVKGYESYIWKKEFQKRGQLHWHITSPAFIYHQEIRDKWNEILRQYGLLDEYMKKAGHYNAPSTEIRQVKNVKNMASYLVKELGKSINAKYVAAKRMVESLVRAGEIPADQESKFVDEYTGDDLKTEGRVWGCSENLGGAPYFSVEMRADTLDQLFKYRDKEQLYWINGDFFAMIFFNEDLPPPWHLLNEREKKNFDDHIAAIFTKPQSGQEIVTAILAENVPTANPELVYTPEQMELCFN